MSTCIALLSFRMASLPISWGLLMLLMLVDSVIGGFV